MNLELLDIPYRWAAAWSSNDPQRWIDLYSPDATYIDHAFQISRTGHDMLKKHHAIWRTANPDFVMKIDSSSPVWQRFTNVTRDYVDFSERTINKGTFKSDLPTKKASGKAFEFSAVVDIRIRDDGLIVRINEWYTKDFDLSVPVQDYNTQR